MAGWSGFVQHVELVFIHRVERVFFVPGFPGVFAVRHFGQQEGIAQVGQLIADLVDVASRIWSELPP